LNGAFYNHLAFQSSKLGYIFYHLANILDQFFAITMKVENLRYVESHKRLFAEISFIKCIAVVRSTERGQLSNKPSGSSIANKIFLPFNPQRRR
jgi:hypothetical protein